MHRSGSTGRPGRASALAAVALMVLAGGLPAQTGFRSGPAMSGRPVRGLDALNKALELQRRGELEEAAKQLDLAQTRSETLTDTERQELARLIDANRAALQARREAQDLLAQTEKALQQGDSARARQM